MKTLKDLVALARAASASKDSRLVLGVLAAAILWRADAIKVALRADERAVWAELVEPVTVVVLRVVV